MRVPSHRPALSVVIPVWGKHRRYLADALATVREGGMDPLDVIVVDNASVDPITVDDPAVRVIRLTERVLVGAVRNAGLAVARAPRVVFWDVDDRLVPGAFARMSREFDADARVVAATMDSVRWTPETGPGERWPWPRSVMYPLSRHQLAFAAVATVYNPFTTTGPAMLLTDAVRDAGGFPEDIAFFEDWALSISLAVRGRVVMLRDIGRWYRVHSDSLSLGHLDHPDQEAWLLAMRRRLRADPRAPRRVKALLPLIRVHHEWRRRRRRRPEVGGGFYETALSEAPGARE